jgi:sortase A
VKFLGVVGELLITIGVIVLLFIGWQFWVNNAILSAQQQQAASNLASQWKATSTPTPKPTPTKSAAPVDYGPPPAFDGSGVGDAQQFATLFIPSLGKDSTRIVANSVDRNSVLNKGIYGKYPDSAFPGNPGNFAMAIHHTNWGSPFAEVTKFQTGEHWFVETEEGWYTYTFRNYEYVVPTQVDVVNPVPGSGADPGDQSIMTITTCNPLLGDAERLISYAVLTSWTPRSAGPPAEMVKALAGHTQSPTPTKKH